MLGAIIGDIVGSRWEFNSTNDYDFEMFSDRNGFTDDTVCTVAVAEAILRKKDFGATLHEWCRRYPCPMGGYGGRFAAWVRSDAPKPYGSFGNGSAMRVSPVGWAFADRESVLAAAEATAVCTHNHPEGVKGAQTVALAIHLALQLRRDYAGRAITRRAIWRNVLDKCVEFAGYDLNVRWDAVCNKFDETCQGTVPVALAIIGCSNSFEEAIRKAVAVGADADTLAAIVGSIAEVIWPIPEEMRKAALGYLPREMREVVKEFCRYVRPLTPRFVPEADERKGVKAVMRYKLGLGNFNNLLEGRSPLPKKDKVATADMGELEAMPDNRDDVSDIALGLEIDERAMDILRKGHIPECQEDHWFMVCDGEYIRYYRSWTGMCAYEAHYSRTDNATYCIDSLRVNRNLAAFGVNGDESSVFLFRYLIAEETGGAAAYAWDEYIEAWEDTDYKYRPK